MALSTVPPWVGPLSDPWPQELAHGAGWFVFCPSRTPTLSFRALAFRLVSHCIHWLYLYTFAFRLALGA